MRLTCAQCNKRPAVYVRYFRYDGRMKCVRRSHPDHPLCRQCFRSLMEHMNQLGLEPKPAESEPVQLQAALLPHRVSLEGLMVQIAACAS